VKCSSSGTKKRRLPEQILTKDEVQKLIRMTQNLRDRAFVSVIYETGCRIGEILFLRLHSIEFDKFGAVVSVPHFGKTGSRRVRIVSSVPELQEWLNKHPDNRNTDAYLWVGPNMDVMAYPAVRSMLSRLAHKAGIRKPVNPHAFRHARATHLASHLTEAQMKIYFGWTQASEMAATYVHLSGRDVDSAILRLNGIRDEETKKEKDSMAPSRCRRCDFENPATNSMCGRCGLPLDDKAATNLLKSELEKDKAGEFVSQLLRDDQIRELLMKKIHAIG
jgi:integrase